MSVVIEIPRDDVAERLRGHWAQGAYEDGNGGLCLHGAVRLCCPVRGDAYIIEQVDILRGYGPRWNDEGLRTEDQVVDWARVMPDITDAELAETFGPRWDAVVSLVRRAATLTDDEGKRLAAARDAAWAAAWAAAWDAARDAAWAAAWAAARDAAGDAAWAAAGDAAWAAAGAAAGALVVRDLIGDKFTQDHYDVLTKPWRDVIGPVHPDD